MEYYIILILLLFVGCSEKKPSIYEYEVLAWKKVYTPLINKLESESNVTFHIDGKFIINSQNALTLSENMTSYLNEYLNSKGKNRWELFEIEGENFQQKFIFKRKKI